MVIGTVAALRAEKNIARLIRALARLPAAAPARLVIVGDGPERAALEALAVAEGVGGRVEFAGHCADPAPLYAGFDIFALSSDTEQMPLSVLEAMASGLPVAATDVGDVAAMLDAANRPYVVAREDGALADALARSRFGATCEPPSAPPTGREPRAYSPRRTWSPPGATCSPVSWLGDEGDAAAFNRGLWGV